jgi:hypothetical protein
MELIVSVSFGLYLLWSVVVALCRPLGDGGPL